MSVNSYVKKLKRGDKVTTAYIESESDLVRKLTLIVKDKTYGSGFRAEADGGALCSECGRSGTAIRSIDASWFFPVKPAKR